MSTALVTGPRGVLGVAVLSVPGVVNCGPFDAGSTQSKQKRELVASGVQTGCSCLLASITCA